MNIYLHELKVNFKSACVWLVTILILTAIMVFMYIGISDDIDLFKQVLSNFPESLRVAFGISIDRIESALGYFSSFVLSMILVSVATQAMILGMSILSKEVREKTADFLYSKPVTRSQIITSKLLAGLTIFVVSNVIFITMLYFSLSYVTSTSFDFNTFMLLALIPSIIEILFFTLGTFISSLMKKVKGALPISLGVVFGLYLLSSFADAKMRALLPFKYFDPNYILDNSKYELKYLLLTTIIIVVTTMLTYVMYNKKDIESV